MDLLQVARSWFTREVTGKKEGGWGNCLHYSLTGIARNGDKGGSSLFSWSLKGTHQNEIAKKWYKLSERRHDWVVNALTTGSEVPGSIPGRSTQVAAWEIAALPQWLLEQSQPYPSGCLSNRSPNKWRLRNLKPFRGWPCTSVKAWLHPGHEFNSRLGQQQQPGREFNSWQGQQQQQHESTTHFSMLHCIFYNPSNTILCKLEAFVCAFLFRQ